jgi:ribosomal protein S18 acetylase RimI-like enzyme
MSRPRKFSATPTQIRYEQSAGAPFGELDLLRPTRRNDVSLSPGLRVGMGFALREAWESSEWLDKIVSAEDARAFRDAVHYTKLGELSLGKRAEQAAEASADHPSRQATWFAVRPNAYNRQLPAGDHVRSHDVAGYAHIKQDVSGSPAQRAVKRAIHPDKVYASLTDVNICPPEQGSGVGVALTDAALGSVKDPGQRVTTFVLGDNQALKERLAGYGFEDSGTHSRNDLIAGYEIPETLMRGSSARELREQIAQSYPWLQHAEVIA